MIIATGKNEAEQIKLMLDIAEAKKWNLATLNITGSESFKKETRRQIAERLMLRESLQQEAVIEENRPATQAQQIKINYDAKQEQQKADKDITIQELKESLKATEVLRYAIDKYQLKAEDYEPTSDNKINNKTNRQKPKNVIDFLQKELHIKTSDAIEICRELYNAQPLEIKADKQEELEAMGLKISVCKDENKNALNKWEQVEVKSYSELSSLMKQYPYSMAEFKGARSGDNIKGYGNALIYDIDNDYEPKLNINEAKQLLQQHGVSAMILPSKSHGIEKFTKSGKCKGVEDRYRIVIPTNKTVNFKGIEEYREFQQLTARALKIDKFLDSQALNDKARFYYKSPVTAEPIIIKADRVMSVDKLASKAIANVKMQREQKEAETQRIEAIKANLNEYRAKPNNSQTSSNSLTYANAERIINEIDIKQLIKHYESVEEYKEGNYIMMKSKEAKYSVIDSNIAHDFKSDTTYNPLTYLQQKLNTTNLNIIAREAQKVTGTIYIEVNQEAVNMAIKKSLTSATNDKSFESGIREYFGVDYCRFNGNSLTIADQHYEVNQEAIIESLRLNRNEQQQQQRDDSYQGMTM